MADFQIISRGGDAGPYQAFPDVCRLKNGDLYCVFYTGYGHVSLPDTSKGWAQGWRICAVRSRDEGKTWSAPITIFDDALDNRDPHVAQLRDGSLLCSFFSLKPGTGGRPYDGIGTQLIRSLDGGKTWDKTAQIIAPVGWYCSAPVRQLPDKTCILGIYYFGGAAKDFGGVIRSTDSGRTWSAPISIGEGQHIPLDAETDMIRLKDGMLLAALRSSKVNLHFSTSHDNGKSWGPACDSGFKGHAPHFTRLKTGEILLTHRLPQTALHVSRDDARTWEGPSEIDNVIGAYPSTLELREGRVLVVYYTEGAESHVRAKRFKLTATGIAFVPW
ncbi:sialidase family protein [Armatimonas sp.]|uniref:sialidase family protein n=1 Tax=Armatimonas sp. TaxID=1872638 RepID=UPI00374D680E